MRELGNILPQARAVTEDRERFNFGTYAERIIKTMGDVSANAVNEDPSRVPLAVTEILVELLQAVEDKAQKQKENKLPASKGDALAMAMPGLDRAAPRSNQWIKDANVLLRWFSSRHHFSHEKRDAVSIDEVSTEVNNFERLLVEFVHTFFGLLDSTREIVAAVDANGGIPTADQAKQIWDAIAISPELANPFFTSLVGPGWISNLRTLGAFAEPPERGRWAASEYLAKVAANAPADVIELSLDYASRQSVCRSKCG